MAELNKIIHIRKGSTEQTVKLYTTQEEAGDAYSYIKVDGVQAYIPLGDENDSRATLGRVKEHTGSKFAILASGKLPYHMDSYTNAGTYTWTCPAGVTKARVTIAGGGGGGLATRWGYIGVYTIYTGAIGGTGGMTTTTINVIPNRTYTVVVGEGGKPYVSTNNNDSVADRHADTGGVSSFDSTSVQGGTGGYFLMKDTSFHDGITYGSGGAGGNTWDTGANAGGTGWVYVEYGGDIQNE